MREQQPHIDVEAAFSPWLRHAQQEARQAEQDWQAYLENRPYQDENGQVHSPCNGQSVNADEEFNGQHQIAADGSRGAERYEDMSLAKLAKKLAEAEFRQDKTSSANINEALLEKLGEEELKISSKRDSEHNDLRWQNLWDRVLSVKNNELQKLGGAQQEVEPMAAKKSVAKAEPKLAESPEPAEESAPAETSVPEAEANEREVVSAEAVAKSEAGEVVQGEEIPQAAESDTAESSNLVVLDKPGEKVDLEALRELVGKDPLRVTYETTAGDVYELENRKIYVYEANGEAQNGERVRKPFGELEKGEKAPVVTIGQVWQQTKEHVTDPISKVEAIYEDVAADGKPERTGEIQSEGKLVRYDAYKHDEEHSWVPTAYEYTVPGTEIAWSDLDDKEALFFTEDGKILYLSGVVDKESGENQKVLYNWTKSKDDDKLVAWGMRGLNSEDISPVVLDEELQLWDGATPTGKIKSVIVENGVYEEGTSKLNNLEERGENPFTPADQLIRYLEEKAQVAEAAEAEAEKPEAQSRPGTYRQSKERKSRVSRKLIATGVVAAILGPLAGIGVSRIGNGDGAPQAKPNTPTKDQISSQHPATTKEHSKAPGKHRKPVTKYWRDRHGQPNVKSVLPKSLR